jgi:hypothetical protein
MKRFAVLLSTITVASAGWFVSSIVIAAERQVVRDTMWIWACCPGVLKVDYGLADTMAPVDGARSMGIPNVIMIRYGDKPRPPFDDFAVSFRTMKKVMWSVTGASGVTSEKERDQVFALAAKMPNITGVFMDDFFQFDTLQRTTGETPAVLSVKSLEQLRKRLTVDGRSLDLGVTLYTHQLDERITAHLKYCDIVSLWTWKSADLAHLEDNLAKLQRLAPGKRTFLGLYMWDFGAKKPMPLSLMKKQCELALKWVHEGRIEGMVFLVTNICNMNLEAVNCSRAWIAKVGDQPLHLPEGRKPPKTDGNVEH